MDLTSIGRGDDKTRLFTRDIVVDFGDGNVLNATVRPLGLSAKTQTIINKAQSVLESGADMDVDDTNSIVLLPARLLHEVVISWDLKDGKKTIPLTMESLSSLPVDILNELVARIMEAIQDAPKATS